MRWGSAVAAEKVTHLFNRKVLPENTENSTTHAVNVSSDKLLCPERWREDSM